MNQQFENYPHLVRLKDEGFSFGIRESISKGVDLFKQNIGGFVGYTALYFVILAAAGVVPFGSILLSPPLAVGWAIVSYRLLKNSHSSFNEFFKGFDDFGQLVLVGLVTLALILAVIIPMSIIGITSGAFIVADEPEFTTVGVIMLVVGMLALFIPIIYLSIAWVWAPYFVVFYKMKFWDAMEASRKVISKRWWKFFVFYFVTGLIAGLGFLFFGIGALFTIPIMYCAQYIVFAEVTNLHDESQTDRLIEDHLVM